MTRREDCHTRTVEDAARFEADNGGPPDDDCDDESNPNPEEFDGPCCNSFDCPCGGDGSGRALRRGRKEP